MPRPIMVDRPMPIPSPRPHPRQGAGRRVAPPRQGCGDEAGPDADAGSPADGVDSQLRVAEKQEDGGSKVAQQAGGGQMPLDHDAGLKHDDEGEQDKQNDQRRRPQDPGPHEWPPADKTHLGEPDSGQRQEAEEAHDRPQTEGAARRRQLEDPHQKAAGGAGEDRPTPASVPAAGDPQRDRQAGRQAYQGQRPVFPHPT